MNVNVEPTSTWLVTQILVMLRRTALSRTSVRALRGFHPHMHGLAHGNLDEFAETSNSFSQRIKVHSNQYDRSLV
jgi:hypothetical protein